MRRHEVLQNLSRDHHFALLQARWLIRCVARGIRPRVRTRATSMFLQFWHTDVSHHFDEEETVLLPLFGRHIALDSDAGVQQMLADHAWIRRTVAEVERQHGANLDPTDLLAPLGRRLMNHVRLEERDIFPRIEACLTDAELDELETTSLTFRRQWRSPRFEDAVGLCRKCQHVQRVESARGSTFYLCRLSRTDPRYPKYPRLPVMSCDGFAPDDSSKPPADDVI